MPGKPAPIAFLLLASLTLACACDPGGEAEWVADATGDVGGGGEHAAHVEALVALLPASTRGFVAVDLHGLLSGASAEPVAALLADEDGDPALRQPFSAIARLAGSLGVSGNMHSALLVQTTDASEGLALLAKVASETVDDLTGGAALTPDGTYGAGDHALYLDGEDRSVALLDGGVLAAGSRSAVTAFLDVADGVGDADDSAIHAFVGALDASAPFTFVYGLPALFDASIGADRSLRGAQVVSGALDFDAGEISGAVAFHTPNAAAFVEAYNALNADATGGETPVERPLAFEEALVDGLGQVVVPIASAPIAKSGEEALLSRNTLKKLFVGMDAWEYAQEVYDPGNASWIDLVVKSEADRDVPLSPGSVFIRWEFKDQEAIEAFERDELPAGFSLAPCQFLESDDPDGEYFLALNLYNAGGGSIVSGARAEWDVFVRPPDGADRDAGTRPRFMVVDALAEAVSADPVHLMTPAEPLSHELVDGQVVTSVKKIEGAEEVLVFESSFARPDAAEAPIARFTREMAIGNDYIYWGHGVYDRVLYNATTFNYDALFVDTEGLAVVDESRWAQYLKPEVKDAVYYGNTLEYVASPWSNLRGEYLDITPEWLAELLAFKNNGHESAIMKQAVEQLFRGGADTLVGFVVENTTPSVYYHFEVTDPDALASAIALPEGFQLAPTSPFAGGTEAHYLTLAVYEIKDAVEGTRAEWRVYADDGGGRERVMVVALQSEEAAVDPVRLLNLPSLVQHELTDGVVSTRLASAEVVFEASFGTSGAGSKALSLDWIEAGDRICHLNGICDKRYYDAETLDVSVSVPVDVTIDAIRTPWDDFIDATPGAVFFRGNRQEYAVKRWHNLRVVVDELPSEGLDGRTHDIGGQGSLVGRTTDVVDSVYSYSGDGVLEGDELRFAIDQEITNLLGVAHILTEGSFDLQTGTGTQTVRECVGPALMCTGIEGGVTSYYEAQNLDASNPDAITWDIDVIVDLGVSFGLADSQSTFTAARID